MDPFRLPKAAAAIVMFGWATWVKLLGPRKAKLLVFGGIALSTLAVFVLEGAAAPAGSSVALNTREANARIIRHVWKSHAPEALSVAECESRLNIWAGYRKHQYHGLFQLGSWERRTYGHGNNAWTQARAAFRYFKASGSDWSPWSCKP